MDARDIHFVVAHWEKWRGLLQRPELDLRPMIPLIVSNEDVWVVQTFVQLARRGWRTTIGPTALAGRINVVDGINLWPISFEPDLFLVACRGDGHYPAFCQLVIQQNDLALPGQPAIYIPQWPQPGIIPRDAHRSGIRTLGFFGHATINLAAEYRDDAFQQALDQLGCRLVVQGRSSDVVAWNDYSKIDLVLSVRNIPAAHLLLKPVNKLSNAWLARVPALVGSEPAIESIRRGPLDYLRVTSPADVLAAIRTLRSDPGLYRRMVEHGTQRAAEFDAEAVASRWLACLPEFRSAYSVWCGLAPASRLADFDRRVGHYHHHMSVHARGIHDGYAGLGHGVEWWAKRDP